MTPQWLVPVLASLALSACAFGDGNDCDGDTSCDDDVVQTCDDARYGDGVCNLQLSCSVPDIDCFHTFASDAEAATWYADYETALAAEEGRAPRKVLPEADPRFAHARALLDRGWEAFQVHRPVGKLARRRPAMVLLEDPAINAFVIPDLAQQQSAFSVQVQTGALASGASDDELVGVMMHELQHAVGLHLIGDTKQRMIKYYVVDGEEPIGNAQADDPEVRELAEAWLASASAVSFYSTLELGGLPLGGDVGRLFNLLLDVGKQANPAGCARSIALSDALRADIRAGIDLLDYQLVLDRAPLPARIKQTMAALRDECFAGVTDSYAVVVADLTGQTPAQVDAALSAHDRALVADKHVIDAIVALAADRRAAMRTIESAFLAQVGQPWSALRYFSYEEDADDQSVTVLRAAGFEPTGEAGLLRLLLPEEPRRRCDAVIAARTVPAYGLDLTDAHHALCWRVDHLHALAEQDERKRAVSTPAPRAATFVAPARLLPPTLAEQIAY